MLYFLSVILAFALAAAVLYNIMIRNELSRLADAMEQNHTAKTYRQLTIGSRQPQIARLAIAVNTLYGDVDADRAATRTSIEEIHQGIANISHDLRTPLTSIIGYLQLMQSESAPAEKRRNYLNTACLKAQNLNTLVGGLFELSVLESGGHSFQYQRIDANTALTEELAGIYAQFDKFGISPELQLCADPLWIIGDPDALHRIFANLLQNMARHGQAPMQIISGTTNGSAYFRFSNNAPMLQKKDIPLIFQRFFTADRMRSGKDTGLGLAIAKEFAEQMNGHIFAELEQEVLTISLSFDLID